MIAGGKLREIEGAKVFMILGVVMIHSDVIYVLSGNDYNKAAGWIVDFLSRLVSGASVAGFFMLSGFLMFRGVGRLTPEIYKRKIRSRIRTLLVPYILWNGIAAVLFIIKTRIWGYADYGVWQGDTFHPWRFLCGFWDLQNGYPFDFVLWFIRNLIVFSLLSPVAYVISRKVWTSTLFFAACLAFDNTLGYFFYFVAGALVARRSGIYEWLNRRAVGIAGGICWLALCVICTFDLSSRAWELAITASYLCALPAYLLLGRLFALSASRWREFIEKATFYVYAFHGLYVSVFRKAVVRMVGSDSFWGVICSYLLVIVGIYGTALMAYWIAQRLLPRFTRILCGGRAA